MLPAGVWSFHIGLYPPFDLCLGRRGRLHEPHRQLHVMLFMLPGHRPYSTIRYSTAQHNTYNMYVHHRIQYTYIIYNTGGYR
jgi:hypothetical protein